MSCIPISTNFTALFLFKVLGFLLSTAVFGNDSSTLPLRLDSLVLQGKKEFYNLQIQKAQQTFSDLQKQFPDYPHGYVYRAYITLIIYGMDQSRDSLRAALNRQIALAQEVAETYKERFSANPDSYFLLGIISGIEGIMHVFDMSLIKAYWDGRKAKGNLEQAIKLDSTFYDAYLGLGIFHYYADLLPGLLRFIAGILGFKGDRHRGMQEMNLTSARGRHFKVEAEFVANCAQYFLEGEKYKTVEAFKQMYTRYPENQAFALLIAYHYRRSGYLQRCIDYCNELSDDFSDLLPLITNLRYYNLGVAYYDLNDFPKADSVFGRLAALPTRKSLYYRAAINYYQGHLADLRFDRHTALSHYHQIPDHKQTDYWYHLSTMPKKYPLDSLLYGYYVSRNMLYSRQFDKSLQQGKDLLARLKSGPDNPNPNLKFLLTDLVAESYYSSGQLRKAKTTYEEIIYDLDSMEDTYRGAWIYIHYSRCLRDLGFYKTAEKMLDKAHRVDDTYLSLIISRDKFILQRQK